MYGVDAFRKQFVDAFPTSQTRESIFEELTKFLSAVFTICTPDELWIDGSFATSKVNPNDADIVIFIGYNEIRGVVQDWEKIRNSFPLLDMYYAVAVNNETKRFVSPDDFNQIVNQRNYWRGQFGFDRQDAAKGIIKLDCIQIKQDLCNKGGENHVNS